MGACSGCSLPRRRTTGRCTQRAQPYLAGTRPRVAHSSALCVNVVTGGACTRGPARSTVVACPRPTRLRPPQAEGVRTACCIVAAVLRTHTRARTTCSSCSAPTSGPGAHLRPSPPGLHGRRRAATPRQSRRRTRDTPRPLGRRHGTLRPPRAPPRLRCCPPRPQTACAAHRIPPPRGAPQEPRGTF